MSSGELTFRDARTGDELAVQQIVDTVLREYGMALEPETTDSDLADIRANFIDRGGVFKVVVDADDRIWGCGGLYLLPNGDLEIRKMYLLPPVRGRGYGRAMLATLVDAAVERGAPRVVLETKSVLREAIALYRRFGFIEVIAEHQTPRCDKAFALELGDGPDFHRFGSKGDRPQSS